VELGDLAPTVLEATGTPRHPGIQTRSLWPFLSRADEHSDDFREDVYCEYYNSNPNKPAQYCTMVRTKKHKLVVMHGQDTGELYDLENDPGEHRNLWSDGRYRETKTALLLRLTDRMAYTADPLPERVGIY
jgi:arylsulfatase A-like enzyme